MTERRRRLSAKLWMLSGELLESFHEAMGVCIEQSLTYDIVTELRQAQLRIHAAARAVDTGEPIEATWERDNDAST